MGEETSWFDLLPGLHNLELFSKQYLARTEFGVQGFPSAFSMTHVWGTVMVLLFVSIGAFAFSRAVAGGGRDAIVPPATFNLRNLFEMFTDAIVNVATGVMGEKNARRFLPLIGTFAVFIFFSNILALIPGFIPPTSTVKTNLALALVVFVMTHIYGLKDNGIAYLKHFLGPIIWLAPLMLIIEIISHIARPVSLTMRLVGNIAADHKVVAAFFALVPILVPVPFLILGVLVCIIQTMVFCILAMVYIQSAVAHEHGDDDHGHGDEAHAHH
jgi:F-type H+-transporting ATPase subunit a